uniref:sodium-dependent glucose transporter 1-like n=1 Tax=Styela clava TaxID=7725 RepID=UPI00193AAC54|nr:sodium-dependent glucose transporter 1-like [Styela clava]
MKSDTIWKTLFLTSVTLARMGQGMYLSISGPTLLYLADHFNVDVSEISIMFTLRSSGAVVGAVSYGVIMNRFSGKFNPLHAFGPTTALLGLMILIIPWLNSLAGLLVSGFVAGFMFAFADGAMQSLYLRIWGEERSRPFIQSFHFGISVGGLITPSIASPFLEMANSDQGTDPNCPDSSKHFQDYTGFSSSYHNTSTTFLPPTDELNPVAWSYVIVGGFSLVASIPLFAFSFCGLDRKIKMREQVQNQITRKNRYTMFGPFFFLYFSFIFLTICWKQYIPTTFIRYQSARQDSRLRKQLI